MLFFLEADIPVFQLFFVLICNGPKIRHKHIIPLLLRQVCRPNTTFAGTKHNNSPPRPLKGKLLIGFVVVSTHFYSFFPYKFYFFVPLQGAGGLYLSFSV